MGPGSTKAQIPDLLYYSQLESGPGGIWSPEVIMFFLFKLF